MVRRILINVTPTHLRIAITEDGQLAELFTEEPESTSHVGNVYLGKVGKIVPGMNAAFVDIGLEQDAFLHFSDDYSYSALALCYFIKLCKKNSSRTGYM